MQKNLFLGEKNTSRISVHEWLVLDWIFKNTDFFSNY